MYVMMVHARLAHFDANKIKIVKGMAILAENSKLPVLCRYGQIYCQHKLKGVE